MSKSTGKRLRPFLFALVIIAATTAINQPIQAQITQGGEPYSFSHPVGPEPQAVVMPPVDVSALLAADEARRNQGIPIPFRYGAPIDVNLGLENAGTWEELPDGARLWRLKIFSPRALSINLIFHEFRLPPGSKFFVYSEDRSTVRGAFTEENNPDGGSYATPLVKGSAIILEYYEPAFARGDGRLRVSRVVHGFRDLFGQGSEGKDSKSVFGFGDSSSCNINVNCPEGGPYRDQQRAVVLIQDSQGALCSGALINNEREDHTPYVLTANHCLVSDPVNWIFYFNYESPNCSNINGPLTDYVVIASLIANNAYSDFALMKLYSVVPKSYNAYYAGWSALGTTPSSTAGIHHPMGDIKKISIDDAFPGKSTQYWDVRWDAGTTEPGSSGSPLFDQNKRIIGQLYAGNASCSTPQSIYGRFSVSWDYGGSSSTRLKDHLDPDNTGTLVLNGKNDTRPFAPTSLTASGCIGCLPDIAWTASTSSNIDHYELWRRTSPEGWQLYQAISGTSWTDSQVTITTSSQADDEYCYRARAVDENGVKSDFSNMDCVLVEESPPWYGVSQEAETMKAAETSLAKTVPSRFALEGNYPNPFNQWTEIRFALPEADHALLEVYDVMGRRIRQLVNGQMEVGYHRVRFIADRLPSGIYVYRLQVGDFTRVGRMVLMN